MYEPTLNISGINSGYVDGGAKTVIPSKALLKLDMRLVGKQNPDEIYQNIEKMIEPIEGVSVIKMVSTPPSSTNIDSIFVKPVLAALEQGFGTDPILEPVMPGTLPNYVWTDILNVPVLIVPYANFDQANHAPNENLKLVNFESGIKSTYHIISEISKIIEGGVKEDEYVKGVRSKYFVFTLVYIGYCICYIDRAAISLALTYIGAEFSLDATLV